MQRISIWTAWDIKNNNEADGRTAGRLKRKGMRGDEIDKGNDGGGTAIFRFMHYIQDFGICIEQGLIENMDGHTWGYALF